MTGVLSSELSPEPRPRPWTLSILPEAIICRQQGPAEHWENQWSQATLSPSEQPPHILCLLGRWHQDLPVSEARSRPPEGMPPRAPRRVDTLPHFHPECTRIQETRLPHYRP